LLDYVGGLLTEAGHSTSRLNVRDLPATALLHADVENAELRAAHERVLLAQAVVVATPVYKAAYSGILKTFLDLLPQTGLTGKLVLPIATGGSPAHMLALDYALRPVLSALSARHVLPSIYAVDKQIVFGDGRLELDAELDQRLRDGVRRLSESLQAIADELLARTRTSSVAVPFSKVRCSV
jgi:FMN reductase